jgi:hypothetical protein
MKNLVTAANRRTLTLVTLALGLLISVGTSLAPARPASKPAGLHVAGNRLLDGHGRRLILRGVNRSGTEYACIQGFGLFDGPSDRRSVRAMASWHINFVRVLLNEDCWLGINGINAAYSGHAYRRAIVDYVRLLHRHGMYVELSLIWAAPGSYPATYQPGSPDEDHSPAMWASMAATFKHDRNVLLAPWGETVVDADCFLSGGVCEATYGPSNTPYATAGMQQAVDVMRANGYRGVIAIPGIVYADDLSQWLSHEPHDPLHQLIAEAHVYGNNRCSSPACLNRNMAPVGAHVPLLLGEFGETYDASSCGSSKTARILHWADAHGASYAGWTWDAWHTCEALISNYDGAPAHRYGRFVESYYGQRASTTHRLR